MSIIKSIKQVLGLSGTASENHFWDGSVPNQLSLKRGTPDAPGAVVLGVANGKVTALATSQTWQNKTASRAFGLVYTNDTGQTIHVFISGIPTTADANIQAYIDGEVFDSPASAIGARAVLYLTIPPGASYVANMGGTPTLEAWKELR